MAYQAAPPFLDRDSLSVARERGMDSQQLKALMSDVLSCIHHSLPDPPISAKPRLAALAEPDGCGGADLFGLLPDALLVNIVSRLPVKDAARTAVLTRRWRPVWLSAPLALVDAHLLPAGGGDKIPSHLERADSDAVAVAVSRILAAHPGPIRSAHLTCSYMDLYRDQVVRWLQHLAVKGVQELVLINRPWPLDLNKPIPTSFFSMAALTRLYLGYWRFPDTAGLPRGACFPHLRELGLYGVFINSRDIHFVLARSPVLAILCFQGHISPLRLRLVSHSLRCVQIVGSDLESIDVVDTPLLERLILPMNLTIDRSSSRIKIGYAPLLRLFGRLETAKHVLQIGNTIIKAGTVVSPSAMVASVKILDLKVRFSVRNDVKMLQSFLRCFPNVETLYIHSNKTTESTGRLNLKFWQESGAVECIKSHISVMAFYDFRGERSELAFLKFFVENAQMLKCLVIVLAKGCFSSMAEASAKVKIVFTGKRAIESCSLVICESAYPEDDIPWNFQKGCDFSCRDPFGFIHRSPFGISRCFI